MNNIIINNPLEQFEIYDLIYFNAPLFGFTKISLTNIGFYLIIIGVLIGIMNFLVLNNGSIVPNRWNIHTEAIYGSILNTVNSQLGRTNEIYLPFAYTVFQLIMFSNLLGLIPYSFTVTSHIAFNMSLTLTIMIGVTIIGLRLHGLKFFAFFIPAGTPLALVPLLVLIEFILYLSRAISLSVRLLANIMGGHILLNMVSSFTWKAMLAGPFFLIISVFPITLLVALMGLELGIAFIQSQVFLILMCSYIKDAIYLH